MDRGELSGKRVAIYARFSSANQREASIDDQVRRGKEFAASRGGSVPEDRIFCDRAVSGASMEREDFEALMRLVDARQLDVVLTEDLSRISRDFADAAAIFKKLQYSNVTLLGISDGIDTSQKHAKLTYGVKSLLVDAYLDDLRDKTLRGLEGRALAGYSTGGLAYGYRSRPIKGAADTIIGYLPEIDEDQARIVRRIFAEYLAGHSYTAIAAMLNTEGVDPPRVHTKHRRKGWMASTIRSFLHNARYIGEWTFGVRRWTKVPGTNKRRYRKREGGPLSRSTRSELRIIEQPLWDAVQRRLQQVYAKYSTMTGPRTGAAPGRASYLLSGMLFCACGAPMVICGGAKRSYKCADHLKRRTCPNALHVYEELVRTRILAALRDHLFSPDAVAYARKKLAQVLGELSRTKTAELEERTKRLARTEQRILGLVRFISEGDQSQYVRETLLDLEVQAKGEKQAIADLEVQARAPIPLPTPENVRQRVMNLDALMADVTRGREALRRYFRDGRIVLLPQPEGHYVARAELFPLVALAETETPQRAGASVYSESCAGRI